MQEIGVQYLICTDISKDGAMQGTNHELYRELSKKFDMKIFISGFFGNAILAILLTILGKKLNVDIYLAAIVVFVWRMLMNLGIIRRYYVEKWSEKLGKNKIKDNKKEENKIVETK